MVQYKLDYFPARGRGEFIRYIFAYADVPYEENTISFDAWRNGEKEKIPFGVIPRLLIDDKSLNQSMAIGRYLADKYNLAGNSEFSKAQANMLVHFIEDIYPKGYLGIVLGHVQQDEKAKTEAWEKLRDAVVKPLFEQFEKYLGDEKYFCGGEITWADLYIAEFTNRVEECFQPGFLKDYPHLKNHTQHVHEIPNIKRYVERRPKMFM